MSSKPPARYSELSNWERSYQRQYDSIRGALRSLQLQANERLKTNKLANLAHDMDCVDRAFEVLSEKKPQATPPEPGCFIPKPKRQLKPKRTLSQELDLVQ